MLKKGPLCYYSQFLTVFDSCILSLTSQTEMPPIKARLSSFLTALSRYLPNISFSKGKGRGRRERADEIREDEEQSRSKLVKQTIIEDSLIENLTVSNVAPRSVPRLTSSASLLQVL